MDNVQHHTFALAQYTHAALSSLRYPNGAPVVRIYSDSAFRSPEAQGPIINFNVLDADSRIVGYSQVGFLSTAPPCSQRARSCLEPGCLPNPEMCRQGRWASLCRSCEEGQAPSEKALCKRSA